ncbi:MAG: hypothetical protein QXF69_01575 [Thermofilaceae archaeon]
MAGGLRDIEVSPAVLTLYASEGRVFCYGDVLEIRSLGGAGLPYELNVSMTGEPAYFTLIYGDAVLLGPGVSTTLRLSPGSSAKLSVCLKAPSPAELVLKFADARYREATESIVRIKVVETDWWDNRFHRRLSLSFGVEKEGFVLFEVLGSGEVYANGVYIGRVHSLQGVDASSMAVVYVRGGASYLLPFQVEAWEPRSDGVVEPRGLREGIVRPYDRLVFAVYASNGTRVDLYVGGRLEERFEAVGRAEHRVIEVEGLRIDLDEYGFAAPGLYVNLSGRIVFPYIARPEIYSDWGSWRPVAVGPVRAIAAFNTTGLSGYVVEAFLMVWGLNLNVTQLEVWPMAIRRGIVLDWAAPLIEAENVSVELVCGTTCNILPLRLEPWGVKLCEDYWQPGDHRFGYFTLLFKWGELGSVKSVRSRLSSFPGG